MFQKKPWTTEEDRLLKYIFQTSNLTKWSHIARKLQEQYGVKGRNGKQCKQRYITHIDSSHPHQQWSFQDEQRMFQYHNEYGNKWAIIGCKLGGRSDNCVKNHFYSRLRKALRKINIVIQQNFRRQYKEIKPNVLYKIVEVAQQKFKLFSSYDKELPQFSNVLKNELIEFSYDDDINKMENEEQQNKQINIEEAKKLLDKIQQFNLHYKKKLKHPRKNSNQEQDLLTPNRYHPNLKKQGSQNSQSEGPSVNPSSETSHLDDNSEDQISRVSHYKRIRRNSEECKQFKDQGQVRTRTRSQGNLNHTALVQKQNNEMKNEGQPILGYIDEYNILEDDENIPPHPLLMKKETSRYSRYSQNNQQKQITHFFEDSEIEMRILPEMNFLNHRQSQFEDKQFYY